MAKGRVDGEAIHAKVVGEGANLGVTKLVTGSVSMTSSVTRCGNWIATALPENRRIGWSSDHPAVTGVTRCSDQRPSNSISVPGLIGTVVTSSRASVAAA